MDTFLLFDLDGVLLEPRGYHKALQETIRLVGYSMGFNMTHLSQEDIYAFEATGITCEWDTCAICLGLMLIESWAHDSATGVPESISPGLPQANGLKTPDWKTFLEELNPLSQDSYTPVEKAASLLKKGRTGSQQEILDELIGQAHNYQRSLTHRVFQELVLGSKQFQSSYQLPPTLDSVSYLTHFDCPTLSARRVQILDSWLGENKRGMIFTNRPSQPPDGLFGTPEAELGAKAAGFNHFPVIGMGDMVWLSSQSGQSIHDFLKPSPVHTLAALLQARGISKKEALSSAANLAHKNLVDQEWQEFKGAKLYVFEDTTTGIRSALAAKELLRDHSIQVNLSLIGITTSRQKQASLSGVGAQVYPDLGQALETLIKQS